ncbi:deaminase domain-containing protein [Saccharothrix saharensis]|uniref:deaminase domain-containing protein n=1 Tax=Saccharothrix saharensis TaxID=571190 RepID=UPI0036BD1087
MTSSVRADATNTVTITYHLTLPDGHVISGTKTCTNLDRLDCPQYYYRQEDHKDERGKPVYLHKWDPDTQLLDWLANQVFVHCRRDTGRYTAAAGGAVGSVDVVDDQGPCHSCRGVLSQFHREYPNVVVKVDYATGDVNRPTKPAGTGKGVYGYADGAVHTGRGWWTKTL